jgi:hypothetical protein
MSVSLARMLHTELAGSGGPAGQLNCLYVAVDAASDPERLCTYWFGDRRVMYEQSSLRSSLLCSGMDLIVWRYNRIKHVKSMSTSLLHLR